ncbi:hypothetical protein [Streptomyces viridosporus]|uniref:hypothetical protein n=1 Tax=Streptomyces viridosporus TaxID=67581 RepID=UPI0009BFC200
MLPPSAIAGVSVVCALGPWVFTQPMVLRLLAAAAAVTAIAGAVVMRHWDVQAGKRVADLTRARAGDEWRFEERVAELESDLEESRELRVKLEQRLRAKRAELAGLRNEHAALLRRYAAAEVERASVLEDRRVLEIEAAVPARALPAGTSETASAAESVEPAGQERPRETPAEAAAASGDADAEPTAPAVFSPEGSQLFLRAEAALARFDTDGGEAADEAAVTDGSAGTAGTDGTTEAARAAGDAGTSESAESAENTENTENTESAETPEPSGGVGSAGDGGAGPATVAESGDAFRAAGAPEAGDAPQRDGSPQGTRAPEDDGPEPPRKRKPTQEDEAREQSGAAGEHGHAAAAPGPATAGDRPARQSSGHFTVPTAVAVVPPTAPVRRPVSEGGFDFFGTKKGAEGSAMEAVQNEDLADVVGQEALALHKAETEAQFKPADEDARGVGQVIDLTAHDETERIDVQGLRSAAS